MTILVSESVRVRSVTLLFVFTIVGTSLVTFTVLWPPTTPDVVVHRLPLSRALEGVAHSGPVFEFTFGAEDDFLGAFEVSGWHYRELGFVWSGQGRHEVWFRLPPESSHAQLDGKILMRLQGYVPDPGLGAQRVFLSVIGSSVAPQLHYISNVPTDVSTTFSGNFDKYIKVVLDVPDALRPRDFGRTDGRTLGVRLILAQVQLDGQTR